MEKMTNLKREFLSFLFSILFPLLSLSTRFPICKKDNPMQKREKVKKTLRRESNVKTKGKRKKERNEWEPIFK